MSMALQYQFREYAAKQGVAGAKSLKFGQNLNLEQAWVRDSYPGLNSNPQEFVTQMASQDFDKVPEAIEL